jgi:predicted DNA-binding transcriptional regulator YafY
MPANKSANIRYRIIDKCLNNKKKRFPSLNDLAEACSDILGTGISTFTIEKDIRAMKQPKPAGFDAPIIYSKQNKGYAYDEIGFSIEELTLEEEEWDALRYAAHLLYQYKEVPVFQHFKQAIERINISFNLNLQPEDDDITQYIQFETAVATAGYQWIADIYNALRKQFAMNISYQNIYKNETKQYLVQPYLLKEYRNRWYVIGWVEIRQDYLTFALDRIINLSLQEARQRLRNDFDPILFFKHSTGIMEGDGKANSITLAINAPFDKLVCLEPIHASQQIIKQSKTGIQIKLNVNINPELCQRILLMGPSCKVISPASFKKHIKEQLQQTLAQY